VQRWRWQYLNDATLAPDFDTGISRESVRRVDAIDCLKMAASAIWRSPAACEWTKLRLAPLRRSFERLCACCKDESGPLFDPNSQQYNSVTGTMHFTDVTHVIADMQRSKKMGRVDVDDYHFVDAGRNMFFHRTKRNVVLAMIFCTGAVCRLLQFCGPKVKPRPLQRQTSCSSCSVTCSCMTKLPSSKQLQIATAVLFPLTSRISLGLEALLRKNNPLLPNLTTACRVSAQCPSPCYSSFARIS